MASSSKKELISSLALSGGGFRAAFYHFGALYGLAEAGRLRNLNVLTTVSGGSIAAAFFLKAVQKAGPFVWDDSAKLAECALTAYQELFQLSRRSPRIIVFSSFRALCQGFVRNEWGFSKALVRLMTRWFSELANALEQASSPTAGPEWRIAATDYKSARRVLLVSNSLSEVQGAGALYVQLNNKELPLAIAASCAVPGVFEPVQFRDLQLGDGGILDNLGAHELKTSAGHRVCVDASAEAAHLPYVEGWGTPTRAMDLLMDHDRALVIDNMATEVISLRETKPDHKKWRVALRSLRTDLDDFTSCEACLLFLAGYQSASGVAFMPAKQPMEGDRQVWNLMELPDKIKASENYKKRAAKTRKSIMEELERGKYGIGFGFRRPSAASILMSLGSLYMSLSTVLLFAIYVLFGLTAGIMQSPAWLQGAPARCVAYAAWAVASTWLAVTYIEKRKGLGFFGWTRQLVGVLLGGAFVPAALLASVLAKCSLMFPVRELPFFTRDRATRLPL